MKKLVAIGFIMAFAGHGFAQGTISTVQVSAVVGAGTGSFLTVTPETIGFGTLNAGPADHRFETTTLTATFFTATAPWSIEVVTENPGNLPGLTSDGGDTMPQFKFNQSNFGIGDPEVDANWTGVSAVWKGVFTNGVTPSASTLGSSASLDVSPITFSFAVDAVGAVQTNYSAQVRFDLVIE